MIFKKNVIKYFYVFLIFSYAITGCSLDEEFKPVDQSSVGKNVDEQMSWNEDFNLKLKGKRIESVYHITVQTEKPNTAGFRLILLSYEQLTGIKWPTTYIIPFSTDEYGKAEIKLDYLFPEKQQNQIKLVDYKIDHPILFSTGTRSFISTSDGSYKFQQTNWIDPYSDSNWNRAELEKKGDTWGLDYLYDNYLYRLGNIEDVDDVKLAVEPKLDELMTAEAFYETSGRLVGLEDKLIPNELTLLTGKEAYLAYIAPDSELSKYSSLYLDFPKENDEYVTEAEAIAYLVRLYGFTKGDGDQQIQADDCISQHPYGDEWQIAIETGFFDSGQSCPEDTPLKWDEALKLITDWLEEFSLLVKVPETTVTLFNEQELNKLFEYGLSETEINIMGYRNVKTLMELFETEIVIEEERQIVIESFLVNKCAPIEDRNSYFCPDGNRAILNLP